MKMVFSTNNKFLVTMIIIVICATVVNYGLYMVLTNFLIKPSETYNLVQMNIITMVIIIGTVSVIMFIIIPKEKVNEMLLSIEKDNKTPEQMVRDMMDEELSEK